MVHIHDTHVLMVSLFYHGHINPMVRYAKLLTSRGIHVTIATTNHARDQILNGLAKQSDFIDFEFFDDGLDAELDREKNLGILLEEYLPRDGVKNLSNLIYALEGKEETLVHSMMQFKPILPIGPLVSPYMLNVGEALEGEEENDLCLDWLDKQGASSVIYIALGSISIMSQSETEALAMALESDSNRRFLWVRKEGENGWGGKTGELPKGFLENTKDRGLIVPWCRQDKVLMHPAIKCFLTHCGWNSTLETISAGVPVIAYPDWTDQPTNAKLLVDVFKVGVRMKKIKDGELGRDEIERCIVEVTTGQRALAMKEQATKWKVAAKKATSSGGSSNMNIENFINAIRGKFV
uniref:Glycosyltransferase n=1 Tax=Chenopodium quinoa TaxID=63459 RepID=A0A803KY34_CHEQI